MKNDETPFLADVDDAVELVALGVEVFEDESHDFGWEIEDARHVWIVMSVNEFWRLLGFSF